MASSDHPYKALPTNRFWKTAVGDMVPRPISDLWTPKFPITTAHRVITVGSCFAQHISKHLMQAGFSWIDSEPAPVDMPVEQQRGQGYGVFSFRTGNIYTPALLEQWIDLALGRITIDNEVFCTDNRYFDPLRPNIPTNGFGSKEEMLQARQHTCASIRAVLSQVDIFVFTLGLTEAWQHRDGYVYPVCPGTINGNFLPETHIFHNYTYGEIVASLTRTFACIHALNPDVRFLLTVSPVPLTATASGCHVLTATTYSKSVLRAAAGFFADNHATVDYFPSYELIAAPLFKGRFYEDNLRSVTDAGVQFVMQHFMSAINVEQRNTTLDAQSSIVVPQEPHHPAQSTKIDDEICEDLILEQWSKRSSATLEVEKTFMLVGDSHMGILGEQMSKEGIPYAGGAIMAGSKWHSLYFTLHQTSYFIPVDADAQERWSETLATASQNADGRKMTIITNIGMHSHSLCSGFVHRYLKTKYGQIPARIDRDDIIYYLISTRSAHFNIVRQFVVAGHRVVWLSDPPVQTGAQVQLFAVFEDALCHYFQATGAKTFNARRWVTANGGWKNIFGSNYQGDGQHGSAEYYRAVFQEIITNHL